MNKLFRRLLRRVGLEDFIPYDEEKQKVVIGEFKALTRLLDFTSEERAYGNIDSYLDRLDSIGDIHDGLQRRLQIVALVIEAGIWYSVWLPPDFYKENNNIEEASVFMSEFYSWLTTGETIE